MQVLVKCIIRKKYIIDINENEFRRKLRSLNIVSLMIRM